MPTKTTKSFDCVEMKRRGAQTLRRTLQDKPPEEQRTYWRERTQALRQRQAHARSTEEEDPR